MGQFLDSMVRQMGREIAHDIYSNLKNEAQSLHPKIEECESISEEFKGNDINPWVFSLILFWPLSSIIIIIKLVKYWNKTETNYYVYKAVPIYKPDRRYNSGYRLDEIRKVKYKFTKPSTIEEILARRNRIKKFLFITIGIPCVLFVILLIISFIQVNC